MKHILKCEKCKTYTMKTKCNCGGEAKSTKPQRYSPQKNIKYRKIARKQELEKK